MNHDFSGKIAVVRDLAEKDVVPAITFLLSGAACAITGQNLIVDGG